MASALQPALRLARLGRLGPEALHKGFHLAARIVLALFQLKLQPLLLAPRLLETVVAAGVEGKPPLVEMQDAIHGLVEKIAVVAHDQHGVRIVLDEVFEPKRTFEVEIVRRLVEEQDIRRGEERTRKRNSHPPAAREFRAWTALRSPIEAETRKDARRAGRRRMGVDIGKPGMNFPDPMRILSRLRFGAQRRKLGMRREHGFEQGLRPAGRFLRDVGDGRVPGKANGAVIRVDLARDQAQQRGLASAVAAHKPNLVPVRNARRRVLEQGPPLDAV